VGLSSEGAPLACVQFCDQCHWQQLNQGRVCTVHNKPCFHIDQYGISAENFTKDNLSKDNLIKDLSAQEATFPY